MLGNDSMLEIRNLSVSFAGAGASVQAVRDVSFTMARGEIVALVGESGSGKSTIGLSIMRLIEQDAAAVIDGEILFKGKNATLLDLAKLPGSQMRRLRGDDIGMVFQEPMSSLNPVFTIGHQLEEAIRTHQSLPRRTARARALEMLELLNIPNPQQNISSYPHQLSGGMVQRVMIAMALSCEPTLLIADEPTTGLDVTIQAQIIEHLQMLQSNTGMSILFITHDLGLVSEIADRVIVLYAGQVVEIAAAAQLFDSPRMPYTQALLASLPQLGRKNDPTYRIEAIPGVVPSASALPRGCAFEPRCQYATPQCAAQIPPLEAQSRDAYVRCFHWRDIEARAS